MFFGKLCSVILLLIHHGGEGLVIQFNLTEDSPLNYKQTHVKVLQLVNIYCLKCEQETQMSDAEVSDEVRNIVSRNNMTVSEELGCFMFCILKASGVVLDNHVLNMKGLNSLAIVYQSTMRPYPRIRAITSVMIACYVKMKNPTRLSNSDLFRGILKCVAMYENQYGPYTVKP